MFKDHQLFSPELTNGHDQRSHIWQASNRPSSPLSTESMSDKVIQNRRKRNPTKRKVIESGSETIPANNGQKEVGRRGRDHVAVRRSKCART